MPHIQHIKQVGALDSLATITTNTLVTAGSTLTIVPRASRLHYKTLRGNIRFTASATGSIVLYHRAGDTTANAGNANVVSVSAASFGTGEVRVDGEYYDVAIYNSSGVDFTVSWAQVLGVR